MPADVAAEARADANPFAPTAEYLARGQVIFEGKGACAACHGREGRGDGLAASGLDPSPRDFTNQAFHEVRTDGELMWVLKNGSPGTAMMPFVGGALTEEEGWLVILYERSLAHR